MQEDGIPNCDPSGRQCVQLTDRTDARFRWEVFNRANRPSPSASERDVRFPAAGIVGGSRFGTPTPEPTGGASSPPSGAQHVGRFLY